jgi:diguanylate cyclase
MNKRWDFTRTGRSRVAAITIAGTLASMAVAVATISYTSQFMDETARAWSFGAAIVLPIAMSAPILYWFASKLRQLALAHDELTRIASQDSLTTCLNRGAFVTLVDAYLSQVDAARRAISGSLLVIDADHFKAINDRFGHSAGDEALRLIASCIKRELRDTDLVGRVGGEEFAVFLPLATLSHAKSVAERIRSEIQGVAFLPAGHEERLSVSVGGAVFDRPVSFNELFGAADNNLYAAKNRGRNRVEFGQLGVAVRGDSVPERRSSVH